MGRISMFCGMENYVFPCISAYYKVITVFWKRIQYSVIQFFSLLLPFSVYIVYYIYINVYIYNIK